MGQRRGRPRDVHADSRILTAAFDKLSTVGFTGLNIDEVAAAAGVAKATLYRRWPTKEQLVLGALQAHAVEESPAPSGEWEQDIRRCVDYLVLSMTRPDGRALVSVIAAAYNNPDLEAPFGRDSPGPAATIYGALATGVREGGLRKDLDIDLAMDLLVSVLLFRLLVTGEALSPTLGASIVDLILEGAAIPDHGEASERGPSRGELAPMEDGSNVTSSGRGG